MEKEYPIRQIDNRPKKSKILELFPEYFNGNEDHDINRAKTISVEEWKRILNARY